MKKIVLFLTACFSLVLCVNGINEAEVLGGFQFLDLILTLLGLGLIKINDVSANFNNPRPSLILNN